MKTAFEKIYDVVKLIPRGRVATYGQVAALAGNHVGQEWWAMHCTITPTPIIFHALCGKP